MNANTDAYLEQVRDLVLKALAPYPVTVYLFGSRATGRDSRLSDVDIAVEPHGTLPQHVLPDLREALEESTIPYHVDVVDVSVVNADFRARIKEEGIIWSACANG